jgi:hypothetical protein
MSDFGNTSSFFQNAPFPRHGQKANDCIQHSRGISGEFEQWRLPMQSIYISRRFAAKYVREAWGMRCSEKWLAKLVVTGGGPRYWKNGRAVLYRRDALDAWVSRRVSGPWTSSSDPDTDDTRPRPPLSYLRSGEGLPFADA